MRNASFNIEVSQAGVDLIKLTDYPAVMVDYNGAGPAYLVVNNGSITKLIYETPECTPIGNPDMTYGDVDDLLREHGVDLLALNLFEGDEVYFGMCSCCDFCYPEPLLRDLARVNGIGFE